MSLILFTLVLTACGQAAPAAGTQAPGSASSGPDASGAGGADPSAAVIDLVDPAGAMAAAELVLRREDRERAGLVNLGPGALDLAAAMDAAEARVLAQARGDATAGSLAGHVAGIGPFAPAPGFNTYLVWATLITMLDDFASEPRSGTVEAEPETLEIAGNTGTITTTMTLNAVVSGSRLSVDITIKTKGQVVDKATGAVLFGIDSIATGHVDVDFCPDAGGQSAANVKLTSSEVYYGGGAGSGGKGVAKEFSGSVTITVGDDANITRVEGAAQASEDSKGGVPPAGSSESELPASTRTASDNIANDGNGHRLDGVPRDIKYGGEGSTPQDQIKLWGSMTMFVDTMVMAAAKEAEKLWKSGKCLELIVDPEGGDVDADEVTDVTATLKHKIEGNELDKPVEATLTGVKTLEPAGEKQPAPATVTYTAGPKEGDWGRIAFKSVSNRGIAEKTVTFTVGGESLKVSLKGKMTSSVAGISYTTTVSAPTVVLSRQADGGYAGSGPATASVKIPIGDCPDPYNQTGTMKLVATREAVADPALPRNWIIAWDPTSSYTTSGFCTIQGQRVDMEAFTGPEGPTAGFMFILGDVVVDPNGGTKQITFTKAVGASTNKIDATMSVEIVKGSNP